LEPAVSAALLPTLQTTSKKEPTLVVLQALVERHALQL
jgi:hypothetical protein